MQDTHVLCCTTQPELLMARGRRVCWATIRDLRARLGNAEARLEDQPGAKASRWADLTQPLARELGGTLSKIQETFRVVKWRCNMHCSSSYTTSVLPCVLPVRLFGGPAHKTIHPRLSMLTHQLEHPCSILGLAVGALSIGVMVLLELRLVRCLDCSPHHFLGA